MRMSNPHDPNTHLEINTNSGKVLEELLQEKRKHSQHFYYVKKQEKSHIYNTYKILSTKKYCYYSVTESHDNLLNFILKTKNHLEKCENDFEEYIKSSFTANTDLSSLYKKIINTLEDLHPFFKSGNNANCYFQSKVIGYFSTTLNQYLIYADKEKNKEYLKILLYHALLPTLISKEKQTITHSSQDNIFFTCPPGFDTLWDEFCYLSHDLSFESPFVPQTNLPQKGSVKVLQSLFELVQVLTYYTYEFHELTNFFPNKLNPGQMFYLFMLQTAKTPFEKELSEPKHLVSPSIFLDIFINAIEEQNRKNNMIVIDDVVGRFNTITDYSLTDLENILNYDVKEECKQRPLNIMSIRTKIPSKWDSLFTTEIYEAYSFEQLIYLELYHLLMEGKGIKKCKNTKCHNLYVANDKRTVYCSACIENRKGSNQSYRDNRTIAQKKRDTEYFRLNNKINSIQDQTKQIDLKQKLSNWRQDSNAIVQKHSDETFNASELKSALNKLSQKYGLNILK